MKPRSSHGFTLTEMLAVMAILVMVIALLLPAMRGAKEAANYAKCAANLNTLGQAYMQLALEKRAEQGANAPAVNDPYGWPGALEPYLDAPGAKACPSDPQVGGIWGGQDPSDEDFEEVVEVGGFDYHHVHDDGHSFSLPMTNASFMVNIRGWNETSQGESRWRAYYGADGPPKGQAVIFATDQQRLYFRLLEENAAWDREHDRNEKQFSFVPTSDDHMDAIGWKSTYPYGGYTRTFRYNGEQVVGRIPGYGDRHRGIIDAPASIISQGESSYGINNRIQFIRHENRILLIDYEKIVAEVVGADAYDIWSAEMQKVEERHNGKINVLMIDGSVTGTHPLDIDPGYTDHHEDLWRPQRDPTLLEE